MLDDAYSAIRTISDVKHANVDGLSYCHNLKYEGCLEGDMVTPREAQDLDTAEDSSQPFNASQGCSAMDLVILSEEAVEDLIAAIAPEP